MFILSLSKRYIVKDANEIHDLDTAIIMNRISIHNREIVQNKYLWQNELLNNFIVFLLLLTNIKICNTKRLKL